MSTVVRIKRHLDSDTLYLPELHELIGEDVEIIVSTTDESARVAVKDEQYRSLWGSVLSDDDPFGPAEEEWEAAE